MTRADFENLIETEHISVVDNNGTSTHYSSIKDSASFDHLPKACYGCIQMPMDKWQIYFTDQAGKIHFFRDIRKEEDALNVLFTFLLYLKNLNVTNAKQ